ncbi:MAG TPA: hypothetical protein PL108_04985, partial [Sediminibacterium sp.]|nr:hypothetical protein [Sediminibacterium sp.]
MKSICFCIICLLPLFNSAVAQKAKLTRTNKAAANQRIFIKNKLYKELSASEYKKFKDSIFANTKDTLTRIGKRTLQFSPATKTSETTTIQDIWVPSS